MTRRAILMGLAVASACLAAASSAAAGTFAVQACGGSSNHAWSYQQTAPDLESGSICPSDGSAYGGIFVRDALGAAQSSVQGSYGRWTFAAPPGLVVTAFTYRRWLHNQEDPDVRVALTTADGTTLEGCTALSAPAFACTLGAPGGESATFSNLNTGALAFGIECTAAPSVECTRGSSIYTHGAVVYDAAVTVADDTSPTLGASGGTLLSAGWVRGVQSAGAIAADASGIRRERVLLVDGPAQEIGSLALACDYTYAKPCADQPSAPGVSVATSALSDGAHKVELTAQDAAGNEGVSQPVVVHTDNNAPASPVAVSIAEGAVTAASALHISWGIPDGQASPIAASHWALCPSAGGACVSGDGAPASAVVPASEGAQDLKVWLQDAAGNSDQATASTTRVAIDRTAPAAPVSLKARDASSTRLTAAWANPTGQVAPITKAHWRVCRVSSGACKTGTVGGLSLSRPVSPGTYDVAVWLEDAAGNVDTHAATHARVHVRHSPGLRISPRLRGPHLSATIGYVPRARGLLRVSIVGRRGARRVFATTRRYLLHGHPLRVSVDVPLKAPRVTVSASYAGDRRYAPQTRATTTVRG